MSKYTVLKRFIFRGMSFAPGDSFEPEAIQCNAAKLRTLLSARMVVPGYTEAPEVAAGKGKKPAQPKEPEKPEEPEGEQTDDGNGAESDEKPEGDVNATQSNENKNSGKSASTSRRGRRN